jgi:hypothetical protein
LITDAPYASLFITDNPVQIDITAKDSRQTGCYSFPFFFVESLKGMYNGHIPKRLVSRKIPARIPRIMAAITVSCPNIIRRAIVTARIIRIILSITPIFLIIDTSSKGYN